MGFDKLIENRNLFFKLSIMILPILILLSACSSSKDPVDVEKFISDSEYAYTLLTTAFEEGRQLSTDEEKEIVTYEIYYGTEDTDYDLDATQSILSSLI